MDLLYKTNITGDPAVDFDHAAHPYGDVMQSKKNQEERIVDVGGFFVVPEGTRKGNL